MSYIYLPKNCPGNDIDVKAIYPIHSATDQNKILNRCMKACENTPGCNAFSYDSKQYGCYLKSKPYSSVSVQDISDLRCYVKKN